MSNTPNAKLPRNVLNIEEIKKFCSYLASRAQSPNVKTWLTSTFRRYMEREYPVVKSVVRKKDINCPAVKILLNALSLMVGLKNVIHSHYHVVDTAEDWLNDALDKGEDVYYVILPGHEDEFMTKIQHFMDYLATFPAEKEIRMTFSQVEDAVRKWDAMLAREKIKGSLTDGVLVCPTNVFDFYEKGAVLVKLVSKQAFKNVGAQMNNCVASYADRKATSVYAVLGPNNVYLAAIEVSSKNKVVQIEAPNHKRVAPDLRSLILDWCKSQNFNISTVEDFEKADDEDEDADEYDDDEEDDDGYYLDND